MEHQGKGMMNMHPNKMNNSCFASLATVIGNVMPLSLFVKVSSLLSSTLFNTISTSSLHIVPNNFPLKKNHLWDQPNNILWLSFMLNVTVVSTKNVKFLEKVNFERLHPYTGKNWPNQENC